jgi:lactoylglutathione lyase
MSLKITAVTHLRLFARPAEWAATREFYATTLGLSEAFLDEQSGVALFSIGELKLLVERVDDEEEANDLAGRFAGISFRVANLAKACAELDQQGVVITGPPRRQPWGDSLAHVRDPAGNTITLIEFGPEPS